jgi:tetratricopeptide (TPR) repeat protein
LADVPAAQTEVSQAEAALLKAIDLAPENQTNSLMLAGLYKASGKSQQALERLNGVLAKTNNFDALMQVALIQEQQTNYPAARDAYEKILAGYPNNPKIAPALNNLACLCYEHFDQLDKAAQLADQARRLAPADPSIADTLGWILYKRGEYSRALSLLSESATSSRLSSDPEIQFHLGMTQYMLGQEAPARLALQTAVQSPKDFAAKPQAVRLLAILSIDPKTADAAAVSDLQKQLNDTPQDPIALSRLGAIQERDGKLDKAADTYQSALKYNPQNSTLAFKLAELYSSPSLNDPQKAFALAKTAHDLAPGDARISALLGRLAFQSGDQTWAGSLLESSARKLPGDPQVSYDLAWALYSLGRVQEAQTKMQLAAKAEPSFPKTEEANRFLAAVAAGSDPSKASQFAAEAQKILRTDPNYVPALMVTALTQEGQGKYDGAAQSYNQVLARYPLFVPATRNLGLLYFAHLEDDKKAYDLTSKAREAFPQDPDIAKALGILTYRKGDYLRASQLLKDSARASKSDAEILYYLGMAQYQLKAKTESKASLQQAMALNLQPKLAADAQRILTELK